MANRGMKVSITSEKNVTAEDILLEANQIWKKVRDSKVNFYDYDAVDNLTAKIREQHPEFSKSYPIVIRHMCQLGAYDSRAMKLWLKKIENNPWKSEEEFIELQTDYVVKLHTAKNPNANKTYLSKIRGDTYKMLMQEHKEFKASVDKYEKSVSDKEKHLREVNSDEFYKFSKIIKDVTEIANTDIATMAESYRVIQDQSVVDLMKATPTVTINDLLREVDEVDKFDIRGRDIPMGINADDLLG